MNDNPTRRSFADLGPYSDFVDAAAASGPLFPGTPVTLRQARDVLRFTVGDERPRDPQRLKTWERDGILGEEISWSVGYGPRTHAWLLKPAGARGPLPGALGLCDHGHFKFFGKEKIADGPDAPPDAVLPFRKTYYGGRAFASALAREGFAVLVHDTFLWGSRKFPLEAMPEADRAAADLFGQTFGHGAIEAEILHYHGAAYLHENHIAKYLNLLGTSLGAVTAYEDRVALNYFSARQDIDAGRIGAIGFSGGGLRASMLGATSDGLAARVVIGMMATYEELLDRHILPHTWMLFPAGWSRIGDVPDIAGCAAPSPLLVQYALDDPLFTPQGMRDAHRRIGEYYAEAGASSAYEGAFFDGPHRFDVPMQEAAFAWLRSRLGADGR